MASDRSSTPGKRPPGMERSIRGPFHLRFCHYSCDLFSPSTHLIMKSGDYDVPGILSNLDCYASWACIPNSPYSGIGVRGYIGISDSFQIPLYISIYIYIYPLYPLTPIPIWGALHIPYVPNVPNTNNVPEQHRAIVPC